MDLSLTESQRLLKNTARDFMQREAPKDVLVALQHSDAGVSPEMWRTAAEAGWLGMLIPARYGGAEGSFTDAGVLFEELGHGPLPGPFFSSAVLGALTVLEAGSDEQRARLLPDVMLGRTILTAAITEPHNSWGPQGIRLRPERTSDGYRLSGTKLFVSDAAAATHLIVVVRTVDGVNDLSLLLVDKSMPGVAARVLPGFLGWQCEVTFDGVEIPAANLLGAEHGGWASLERALEKATPILCAYAVGGCQAVFGMSVAYSQDRVQFGVPIGKFQRVQDHIIRLVNHLDSARLTTYEALWKLDTGRPAAAGVHKAKAIAAEAYLEACNAAHEVHAGIGSSYEYGLVKHTQMSRTLFHMLGDPKWHKRRMADALAW